MWLQISMKLNPPKMGRLEQPGSSCGLPKRNIFECVVYFLTSFPSSWQIAMHMLFSSFFSCRGRKTWVTSSPQKNRFVDQLWHRLKSDVCSKAVSFWNHCHYWSKAFKDFRKSCCLFSYSIFSMCLLKSECGFFLRPGEIPCKWATFSLWSSCEEISKRSSERSLTESSACRRVYSSRFSHYASLLICSSLTVLSKCNWTPHPPIKQNKTKQNI